MNPITERRHGTPLLSAVRQCATRNAIALILWYRLVLQARRARKVIAANWTKVLYVGIAELRRPTLTLPRLAGCGGCQITRT